MSDNKTLKKKGFFKKLSISKRLTIVFIGLSFFAFFIGGNIIFIKQKRESFRLLFNKLEIINRVKKQEIENYFSQLENHIKILSDYDLFVNATKDLKPAFRLIEPSGLTAELAPTEMENYVVESKRFYIETYLELLNNTGIMEYSLEDIFPEETRSVLLQYLFIASNPNDFENKKLYDKPINSGDYGQLHYKYNPKIRELAQKYNIDDVYLIDPETGHIFYSLNKNPDFATSLLSGPYRNSSFARNYKETNKANLKNHVTITDLEFYAPTGLQPVMFVSSPLFVDGKKAAILTFQINAQQINNLVNKGLDWEQVDMGKTCEINIVGNDNKLRTNTRSMSENSLQFIEELEKKGVEQETIDKIIRNNSTILLLTNDCHKQSYKPGLDNHKSIYTNYSKNKVHSVIQKLDISNLNWSIVTLKEKTESMGSANKTRLLFFIVGIGIIAISYILARVYSKYLLARILIIRKAIQTLSKGEKFEAIDDDRDDEISDSILALNRLNERIDSASNFTLNMGKGNFDITFEPYSNKDMLGISLNETKTLLEKAKQKEEERAIEERKRNWATEGIAVFSDLLRLNNNDINKLSYVIVGKIVEYLDVSLAGVFLMNEEKTPPVLELSASYAYDRYKFLKKEIALGEGLVGTCAQEQKTIFIKEVPQDYIQVSSGFGQTKPKNLLLVPMIVEKKIMGVIEIGSMKIIEDYQVEFVEKIGENIGATLTNVRINQQTSILLEESKSKSEEMSAQEEELRQNLEELKTTQEEVRRQKDRAFKNEEKIRAILNGTKDGILTIIENKIDVSNDAVTSLTGYTLEELKGMSIFTIFKFLKIDKIRYGEKMRQKVICKDKSKFMAEIIVSKLEDEDQSSLLFFIRNIDEQIRQEQELIKALEAAEQLKNELKNKK